MRVRQSTMHKAERVLLDIYVRMSILSIQRKITDEIASWNNKNICPACCYYFVMLSRV